MARFYSNENFPLEAVELLRGMGHDVLTSYDAGNANQRIPDAEVLQFAISQGRCVITFNRLDFKRLHAQNSNHAGIIICTTESNVGRLALHIHEKTMAHEDLPGQLIRVYEGG